MNYDIKLSPEGDLILGQQQLDEDGYFLYYKKDEDQPLEITRDPEGNTPIRDISIVYGEDSELQLIKSRLQTDNPDWSQYKEVGANLSDLIGEINSPETAQRGIEMIQRALTYDGAFDDEELEIEAVPVNPEQLLFDIRLIREIRYIRYPVLFDFNVGVMNGYE